MNNERTFAETIALIREGKMAIENNGTVQQLQGFLAECWPEYEWEATGIYEYYHEFKGGWVASDFINIDSIPVTDLLAMQEKENKPEDWFTIDRGGCDKAKECISKGPSECECYKQKSAAPCEAIGEEKLKEGDAGFKWFTCPTCDGRGSVPQGQHIPSSESQEELIENECKEFASWIMNTAIQGRTLTKLWIDYQSIRKPIKP